MLPLSGTVASRFACVAGAVQSSGPLQLIRRWVVSRASKLSYGTNLSVAEVALATGYASEPAFARTVRRTTGLSPGRALRVRQRYGYTKRELLLLRPRGRDVKSTGQQSKHNAHARPMLDTCRF